MLIPGSKVPDFKTVACVSIEKGKEFKNVSSKELEGKWVVFYTYPKDFTFVCPTEIVEFDKRLGDFRDRDAEIVGGSTDNEFSHLAWCQSHSDLKGLKHPLIAAQKLAAELGILEPTEGVCLRATFVVDPDGIIQFASANGLNVGRNVEEVVRVLDALQTDELCPCNWKKGEATIGV